MSSNPSSSLPSSPVPSVVIQRVPICEKRNIRALTHIFDLVNRYQLNDTARLDTVDGAKGLSRKVKAVIGRHAVAANGKIAGRWNWISCHDRSSMVKALNSSATWLRSFENHWLSEWVLAKGINQRVTDMNRASYKRREEERRKLAASNSLEVRPTMARLTPPTLSIPTTQQDSENTPPTPVDPQLIQLSSNPTTPNPITPPPIPNDREQEVALLRAELEALKRLQDTVNNQLQQDYTCTSRSEEQLQLASTSTRRRTRKKPTSQLYREAIGIERESADEREVRRAENSTKRVKSKVAQQELGKTLEYYSHQGTE